MPFACEASVASQVDKQMTVFYGTVHKDNLANYYSLVREMLAMPAFKQDDLDRIKTNTVSNLDAGLRRADDEETGKEVLYGAIAARTSKMRIGYGVRLAPKPYNHPVRSAASAAVLNLVSNSRALAYTPTTPGRYGWRRSDTSSTAGPTSTPSSRASTGRFPGAAFNPSPFRIRTPRCTAPRAARVAIS